MPYRNMQLYAREVGYAPFTSLPARVQAEIELSTTAIAAEHWWRRTRVQRGYDGPEAFAWEPLKVPV